MANKALHSGGLAWILLFTQQAFEAESEDLTIHCATCSQPVTLKKAMHHLERCFSKVSDRREEGGEEGREGGRRGEENLMIK